VSARVQICSARRRNFAGTRTSAVGVNSQLAGTGKTSAGQSCNCKYSATGMAEASSGQARKHCQFGKAPITLRVIQLSQGSSRRPQARRLTIRLSGRALTPDRRREPKPCPALATRPHAPHGPLQPRVRRHQLNPLWSERTQPLFQRFQLATRRAEANAPPNLATA